MSDPKCGNLSDSQEALIQEETKALWPHRILDSSIKFTDFESSYLGIGKVKSES